MRHVPAGITSFKHSFVFGWSFAPETWQEFAQRYATYVHTTDASAACPWSGRDEPRPLIIGS